MKTMLVMLTIVSGIALAACAVSPVPDEAPSVPAARAATSDPVTLGTAPELSDPETALSCPAGWHQSCYLTFGCGCCPSGEVLDCFGPGDCYCCSGTDCM